jgi:uncharacterized protein with FMN-binding domain
MKKLSVAVLIAVIFAIYNWLGKSQPVTTVADIGNADSSPTPATNSTGTPSEKGAYKDGEYTGVAADAFYGNVQVKAVVSNNRLAEVVVLQSPNDRRTSMMINGQAMPMLKSEAVTAQSAKVDIVSGATDSSRAFIQSLESALEQAK